jgi:hypothetical protein
MKKFFPLLILALASSAFADSKVACEIIKGQFDNSALKVKELSFESPASEFALALPGKLNINVFDKVESFVNKAVSVSSGTKLDYTSESSDKVRAVVLVEKTPGQAYDDGKFNGLLVITGTNIKLDMDRGPLLSEASLVYQFECKTK